MIQTECLFDEPLAVADPEGILQVYTWMGSKKRAAATVWRYLGTDITLYAEPFAGSGAVWLNSPEPNKVKNAYLNDWDCHIANVMRSIRYHPDEVTEWACHPRLEIDLHMAHDYIYNGREKMRGLLATGLDVCDPKWAGLWIWGANNWLGGNWGTCSIVADDLALANHDLDEFRDVEGTGRQKLCHRNPATEQLVEGTNRKKFNNCNRATESLVEGTGRNKLDHGNQVTESLVEGTGRNKPSHRNPATESLVEGTGRNKLCTRNRATEQLAPDRYEHVHHIIMRAYAKLRDTKILNGDFERLLTDSYLNDGRPAGVYMDPPYPDTNLVNSGNTYGDAAKEKDTFARAMAWYLSHCERDNLRVILSCQRHNLEGYDIPSSVRIIEWKRPGGYNSGNSGKAAPREEVMLISKGCKV